MAWEVELVASYPARYRQVGLWETSWIETLMEKERMGKEGKGPSKRERLEIQRVAKQGWLGGKKQVFCSTDTWSSNLVV